LEQKKKKNQTNKPTGRTLPDLKSYYKGIVIEAIQDWHKNNPTDQWNRLENLGINLCIHPQLICNEAEEHARGKGYIFSKWCWRKWLPMLVRMKLDLYITPFTKIN
jgi:hypothetical protein